MGSMPEKTVVAAHTQSEIGWVGAAFFLAATAAFLGSGLVALYTTFF